ncbi:hypothetical protein GA029_26610 [Bacteroides thetaiotaomicron]|nr:hypothetical protein GA029_26610 [Bacteroides thetaiotaomicron]
MNSKAVYGMISARCCKMDDKELIAALRYHGTTMGTRKGCPRYKICEEMGGNKCLEGLLLEAAEKLDELDNDR